MVTKKTYPTRLTIELEENLRAKFKSAVSLENKNMKEKILELIHSYLKNRRKK